MQSDACHTGYNLAYPVSRHWKEHRIMAYVCIGVPYWIGEKQAVSAVDAVRESGIALSLNAPWVEITPDFAAHSDPVAAVNIALAEAIEAHADRTPLIFAGDCVSALGAMKGLRRHQPAVVWFDSHGDFNTPATTPSGFLGGMPVAALVGRGNEALMAAVGLTPIPETDVIITDARDLDPQEGVNLRDSDLCHLPDANDLLTFPLPQRPLYIHLDTDVIDAAEMPAMNYPVYGGPSTEQVAVVVERIAREGQIVGVLFTLWNESLEGADRALAQTLRLVRAVTS
jgi:arginase